MGRAQSEHLQGPLSLEEETDSQRRAQGHTPAKRQNQSPGPSTKDESRPFPTSVLFWRRDYLPAGIRAPLGSVRGVLLPFLRMLVSCLLKLSSPLVVNLEQGWLMPDGVLGTHVSEQEALGLHRSRCKPHFWS